MKQDYETRAYIAWNLEDAHEELTRILDGISPDKEIDEDEFRVRMAHLYSHLNTAWNVRNASASDLDSAGGKQLNSWMRFPEDIEVP
ncbi:MAG TPA: hypothetical protein VGW12_10430 [Pyrinomonadaceae bacterium]|nr:hypothetical protein [Pyrinomonadaceae bacterium]